MRRRLTYIWEVIKDAAQGFNNDNCFRFSAALSFYTLFSIAPVVMIAIYIASLFADDVVIREEISNQFSALIGERGAEGIMVLMETLRREDQSFFAVVISIGVLIFSATNIFIQIQTSFNEIFKVTVREGKGVVKLIIDRLISLGMILSLGFVLIISLVLDAIIVGLMDSLSARFSALSIGLATLAEYILILSIITAFIMALFRVLPDVYIRRKYLFRSSLLTAVLLVVGKFAISWYIGNSNLSDLGGASSSVIILMLWVYYSSLILFIGAEVLRAQFSVSAYEIRPKRYAVRIDTVILKNQETKEQEVDRKVREIKKKES
jgi:membrane protein